MAESIAASLSGIDKDMVFIKEINIVDRRRLSGSRRLAGSNVKVDYELLVPETYTGEAISTSSLNTATLISNVQTKAAAAGLPAVTISGVTQDEPVSTALNTETPVTGAAQPMAGSALRSVLIALVLALA